MKCTIVIAIAAVFIGVIVIGAATAEAQQKGQSAKIHYGYVVGAECVAAKTELAAAKTDAEFDRAMTKVSILCND